MLKFDLNLLENFELNISVHQRSVLFLFPIMEDVSAKQKGVCYVENVCRWHCFDE